MRTTPRGGRILVLAFVSFSIAPACTPAATPLDAPAEPSRPTVVFPAEQEISSMPSLPAPPEAFATDAIGVESWSPTAEPAPQDDPAAYDDGSAWGGVARSLASDHAAQARLSPAMRCAAAEIARFHLDHGGLPTESLRRFLVARCGGSAPEAVPLAITLKAPAAVTDAAIFDHTADDLRRLVESHLTGGHWAFGLGTARKEGRFVAVGMLGEDDAVLQSPTRPAEAPRRVIVRGRLREAAADAFALVNRGDYATRPCERDPAARLPGFAFSCELDGADRTAWAQVMVRREGRLLSHSVADLLLTAADAGPLEYHARASGSATPVADAPGFASALLAAINRVRSDGKLAPLASATKQSAHDARLAGTFIDANLNHRDQEADRIALGLLAGWDVDGTIRDGRLFVALVAPTRDATAWLDFALERPFGRDVLLAPDARTIAIGPALPANGGAALGAVVTTYALFESPDHRADAARIVAQVKAARVARHKPPLAWVDAGPEAREQEQRVLRGEQEPSVALQTVMQSFAERTHAEIHGFVAEANELDAAPIPEALLQVAGGSMAIVVTHHKVRGAAWGQYAILYLLVPAESATPSVSL